MSHLKSPHGGGINVSSNSPHFTRAESHVKSTFTSCDFCRVHS